MGDVSQEPASVVNACCSPPYTAEGHGRVTNPSQRAELFHSAHYFEVVAGLSWVAGAGPVGSCCPVPVQSAAVEAVTQGTDSVAGRGNNAHGR